MSSIISYYVFLVKLVFLRIVTSKRLGGMISHNGDLISQINTDELELLSPQTKANKINTAFLEPLEQYRLPSTLSLMPLEKSPEFLPKDWKMADMFSLPKKKPIEDLKKDLRPIFLTPCISKLAEDFVVEDFIKPAGVGKEPGYEVAALKVITSNQFGVIPKSSTTQALISMLHH